MLPSMVCFIIGYGLYKRVDVFACFVGGAKEGLGVGVKILPSLIALVVAVRMLRASGAMDLILMLFAPIAKLFGIPSEVFPLSIMHTVSGSGGLALYKSVIDDHGPDSFIGRVASVIQGSTETTLYTIAVYYGALKIKKTRHTLAASLSADFANLIFSVLFVKLLFG